MGSSSVKRTNINLDRELVHAASEVLGTAQTTETVHTALRDVVDRAARRRLADRDFDDLSPAVLDRMRRSHASDYSPSIAVTPATNRSATATMRSASSPDTVTAA
jgi:Arc/MetJ family transcription regulator